MTFLYRCVAYIEDATGSSKQPDTHVFFECMPLVDPAQRAQQLLAAVWNTPVELIGVYNVVSDDEAINRWAIGPSSTGDARLMEVGVGDGGRVAYIQADRCLMLVSPSNLPRLAQAQRDADCLHQAGYTVPTLARAA